MADHIRYSNRAAFVVGAAVARGSLAERVLVAAVGVAWLTASFLPAARSLPQAVLVVSLVAFPTGRVRGLSRWVLACLAVPVAFGLLPQIGVAAAFTLVALLVLIEGRRDTATAYPTVAAIAVAANRPAPYAAHQQLSPDHGPTAAPAAGVKAGRRPPTGQLRFPRIVEGSS